MAKGHLHIIMLFDVPSKALTKVNAKELIHSSEDYQDEQDVYGALQKLGHKVELFAIYSNLDELVAKVQSEKFDIAFTMFETYDNDRSLAPHLTSMLEVLNLPYTGASPATLNICRDKSLTKKILSFHGINTPAFLVVKREEKLSVPVELNFPVIVKPLGLDASEGIVRNSIAHTPAEVSDRIRQLRKDFDTDAIVEEYIEGRELYVGIIAGKEIAVFPPQELHFRNAPKSLPRILTYKAKWDEKYRKKYGIDSGSPKHISARLRDEIEKFSKSVAKALELSGYARLDLRVREDGTVFLIEANPNPAIKRDDDFPQSAKHAGFTYEQLIANILKITDAA